MRNSIKLMLLFMAVPALALLESCHMDDEMIIPPGTDLDPHTFFGESVDVGDGEARAWVAVDADGDPRAVGINFTEEALENLPDEPMEFVLNFPSNRGKDFYTHATLDWNPEGHEPPGTYDKPHFDFHFYIISEEERMAIGPNDTVQFANAPDSIYVPAGYMQTPGGVPHMGAHWVDLMAPEFTGGTFSKTFILGSYNGKFTYWEPMATIDYLETHPDDIIPLRQPQAYQRDGWYPTKWKVSYSSVNDEYTVALMNLKYHEGKE